MVTMLAVPTQRENVYAALSAWEGLSGLERAMRLRAALLKAGINQSDLSRFLGVSQTIVSKWANDRGEMSWPRWLSVCQIADVPMSWAPDAELLHRAWEEWRDEAKKRDRDFRVPEPPRPPKRSTR